MFCSRLTRQVFARPQQQVRRQFFSLQASMPTQVNKSSADASSAARSLSGDVIVDSSYGAGLPLSVSASLQTADGVQPSFVVNWRWPSRVEQAQIAPLDA